MKRILILLPFLCGCSARGGLAGASAGLKTAEDVARTACRLLENTDGSPDAVLAAIADLQKQIVQARTKRALERGADAAAIDAMVASLAAMQASMVTVSGQIARLAGDAKPLNVQPCPVSVPTPSALPAVMNEPAVSAPAAAAPSSATAIP